MTGSAHVQSIQDLTELRAFLITLAEKIRDAVTTANSEANQTAQWINHTQPARWKAECTKSERTLQDATEALRRKRMSPTTDGRPPNTMLEQKIVRQAKERHEHARLKAAAVQQWQRKYDKQMYEYRRSAQGALALVDVVIPKAIEFLDRLRDHLEKYTQVAFSHELPPGSAVAASEDQEQAESITLPLPDDLIDLLDATLKPAPAPGSSDDDTEEPQP